MKPEPELAESTCFDLSELINGIEIVSPTPKLNHQEIAGVIFLCLKIFNRKHKLGRAFISPLDVILEDGLTRLQPDVMFILKENEGILQDWVRGTPDVVFEIISPSSLHYDSFEKKDIYERYGVKEYWLLNPQEGVVELFSLQQAKFVLTSKISDSGTIASGVLPGFSLVFGTGWGFIPDSIEAGG